MRWNLSNRVVGLSSGVLLIAPTASAVCASTPVAAVSLSETSGEKAMQGDDGYRVMSVRWDPGASAGVGDGGAVWASGVA